MKKHRKPILECMTEGWKAQAKLVEAPTLSFTVQMDGRVTDVVVYFLKYHHMPTAACIEREARKWSFPVKSREPTLVKTTLPREDFYRHKLLYKERSRYHPQHFQYRP